MNFVGRTLLVISKYTTKYLYKEEAIVLQVAMMCGITKREISLNNN
jgi:hypothetical protein